MAAAQCTDEEFVALWRSHSGSAVRVAEALKCSERAISSRRRRIEARTGELLLNFTKGPGLKEIERTWTKRLGLELRFGTIVVFSDAHYSPGVESRAHRGLLAVIAELKPDVVIANGDILEGGLISRHAPLGWGRKPTVKEELEAVSLRMQEVVAASRRANPSAKLLRTKGNHDARFDIFLSQNASPFEGVPGFSLADHLPEWKESISIMVNDGKGVTPTMIKHRWHNGIHATYNNLLKAGCHIVTGHLHRLKEDRWGDYRGRRYSVDTGTLAELTQDEFEYTEDNANPWGSGFAVLTYHDYRLLPPELAEVMDCGLVFRSNIYKV
jgi:hypothetical protein